MGQTPMSYCQKQSFAERVKKLQLVTDAFVSVGHTDNTDRVIAMLVDEAKKTGLVSARASRGRPRSKRR